MGLRAVLLEEEDAVLRARLDKVLNMGGARLSTLKLASDKYDIIKLGPGLEVRSDINTGVIKGTNDHTGFLNFLRHVKLFELFLRCLEVSQCLTVSYNTVKR